MEVADEISMSEPRYGKAAMMSRPNHPGPNPGVDMADELPANITNPPLTVHYLSLARITTGSLKSHCPFCAEGTLPMERHPRTLRLIDQDRCVSCGQAVVYADLKEAFPSGSSDEKQETRYNRDAGFPCRRCGTPVTPVFQGNALISFYCPKCQEDFMP